MQAKQHNSPVMALVALLVLALPVLLCIALWSPRLIWGHRYAKVQRCAHNLRMIQNAKEEWWKREQGEGGAISDGSEVDLSAMLAYIKGNSLPTCSAKGDYQIGVVGATPRCTEHGTLEEATQTMAEMPGE